MTALKQTSEYGISQGGQRIAGMLLFLSDIHSVGLETAQGLTLTTGFTGITTIRPVNGRNALVSVWEAKCRRWCMPGFILQS